MVNLPYLAGGTVASLVVITIATKFLGKLKAGSSVPKQRARAGDKIVAKAIEKGDYAAAAARTAETGDLPGAYELYLLAQQPLMAAQTALAMGKPAVAGELYEKAGDKERAVVAYRLAEMGSKARELEAEIERERGGAAAKASGKLAGPTDRAEQTEAKWRAAVKDARGSPSAKEQLDAAAHAAAEAWISAGDMRRAAELCRDAGLVDYAVNLYVNALGEPGSAAELMTAQGDHKRAAELYELGGRVEDSVDAWIAWSKSVDDPLACLDEVRRLGEKATSKFCDAVMKARPIVPDNLDLHYRIAVAIDHDPARAKAVVDRISALRPGYRDVGARLEQLTEAVARLPPSEPPPEETEGDENPPASSAAGARASSGGGSGGGAGAPDSRVAASSTAADVGRVPPVGSLRGLIGGQTPDLGNIEVYYRLGISLLGRGKYAEALRAFTMVDEVSPGYRDAKPRAREIDAWRRDAIQSLALGGDPVRILKRYTLQGILGRGDMSVVFRGRDETVGKDVAIKVPTDEALDHPAFVESFERHAQGARNLSHANIVTIHDVGKLEDRPFVCMELVNGLSVDSLLEKDARLPAKTVLAIAEGALGALAHAHKKLLLHRGIKPSNVMQGPTGSVKVLDFGLAASIDLADPEISGSPTYMAPEQLDGGSVDPRTDLFSLGVTLYEMLTGEPPFEGVARTGTPRGIREVVPSASAALEEVIARSIEIDADRRFASADEMLEAVRRMR